MTAPSSAYSLEREKPPAQFTAGARCTAVCVLVLANNGLESRGAGSETRGSSARGVPGCAGGREACPGAELPARQCSHRELETAATFPFLFSLSRM